MRTNSILLLLLLFSCVPLLCIASSSETCASGGNCGDASGVVRVGACGGLANKIYGLVHGTLLARRIGAKVQYDPVILNRLPYLGSWNSGHKKTGLYEVFDESSLQQAAVEMGVEVVVDDERQPAYTEPPEKQRGVKEWLTISSPITRDDAVIKLTCGYRTVCPFDDRVEGLSCCGVSNPSSSSAVESAERDLKLTRNFLLTIKPVAPIPQVAEQILNQVRAKNDGKFVALHLRLEDDWYLSKADTRTCYMEVPEVIAALRALSFADELSSLSLYVMGGYRQDDPRLQDLAAAFKVVSKEDFFDLDNLLDFDQQGYLDFEVGKHATYLIGNQCSTFTALLRLWRMHNGHNDDTFAYYTGTNTTACEYTWLALPPN